MSFVIIIDAREVVRKGLRTIFTGYPVKIDVQEALEDSILNGTCELCEPDLILIHQSCITDLRHLPLHKCVIMSDNPDMLLLYFARLHQARGYCSEHVTASDLCDMLRHSHFGLDSYLASQLGRNFFNLSLEEALTARELETFELLCTGLNDGEIAQQMYIGEATVRAHVAAILRKLNLTRRHINTSIVRRKGREHKEVQYKNENNRL